MNAAFARLLTRTPLLFPVSPGRSERSAEHRLPLCATPARLPGERFDTRGSGRRLQGLVSKGIDRGANTVLTTVATRHSSLSLTRLRT